MTKITENEIESFAIELLDSFDFKYIYAPNIVFDAKYLQRIIHEHR